MDIKEQIACWILHHEGGKLEWHQLSDNLRSKYLEEANRLIEYVPDLAALLKIYEQADGDVSRLVVMAENQTLPTPHKPTRDLFKLNRGELHAFDTGHFSAQQDMRDDNWVKVLEVKK